MLGPFRASEHGPLPEHLQALRFRVLGCAFRVHSALGPSLREGVYRRCLAHSLRREGLRVEVEKRHDLAFEGLALDGVLRLDVVVENAVVLELKAAEAHREVWGAQVLSYLWHGGYPLGYVINFRVPHLRQGILPFINSAALAGSTPSASSVSSASSPHDGS